MSKRFVAPASFGPWGLVSLISLIWQLSTPVHAQTQAQVLPAPAHKRVLLLYSYNEWMPAYQKTTPAFIRVATEGGIDLNDLFFEYLDLQHNTSGENRQRLGALRFPVGVE